MYNQKNETFCLGDLYQGNSTNAANIAACHDTRAMQGAFHEPNVIFKSGNERAFVSDGLHAVDRGKNSSAIFKAVAKSGTGPLCFS